MVVRTPRTVSLACPFSLSFESSDSIGFGLFAQRARNRYRNDMPFELEVVELHRALLHSQRCVWSPLRIYKFGERPHRLWPTLVVSFSFEPLVEDRACNLPGDCFYQTERFGALNTFTEPSTCSTFSLHRITHTLLRFPRTMRLPSWYRVRAIPSFPLARPLLSASTQDCSPKRKHPNILTPAGVAPTR